MKVFANKFNIHEDYTNTDGGKDICLIELPGNFAGGRAPCMLQPTEGETAKETIAKYHGAQCWVAGWGHTFYAGQSSNVARSVGLNLLSNQYCIDHRKRSIYMRFNYYVIITLS